MKKFGWMSMAVVLASSPFALTLAHAAEDVPFEACRNVVRVSDAKQLQAYIKKGCLNVTQDFATPNASDTVKTSPAILRIGLALGNMAKTQYIPDLEKRIKYWEGVKSCFDKPSSSAACQKRVSAIEGTYGSFVGKLRQELAQANLTDDKKVKSELNSFKTDSLGFIPEGFPKAVEGDLSSSEIKSANDQLAKRSGSSDSIEKNAQKAYVKTMGEGVLKNGLYLVSYLPKPASVDNGSAKWSKGDWDKTLDRLIADAKHEIAVTHRAIEENKVNFPPIGTRDFNIFKGEDRDLMYFATMKPEMEKYLAKHPSDCGAAIAAVKWMPKLEHDKFLNNILAFAAGSVGGAGMGAAKELTGIARWGSAAIGTAGGYAGVAMLGNDYMNTHYEERAARTQVAKIGVEKDKNGKSVEGDLVDPAKYAQAKDAADHWVKNQAVGLLAFGGGAAVFGKLSSSIARAMVASKPAAREAAAASLTKELMHAKDPEKLMHEIQTTTPAQYHENVMAVTESDQARHGLMLAKKTNESLRQMVDDKMLDQKELAQVEELLQKSEPKLALALAAKGKCKGEECHIKSVDEIGDDLEKAKKTCSAPGAAK
jgi:hypothetical protein